MVFRVLSATGMLGSGFQESSIQAAVAQGVDMIGADAGSTDQGPAALATGVAQFSRPAVKRDTELMLRYGRQAGVPVVIGSAGTGGGSGNLEWMLDIVREIAREQGLSFRLAAIDSEQSQETIRRLHEEGRIRPLEGAAPLTERDIEDSLHIVAMMGAEPIQEAVRRGAEVVIAGRSSDTAVFASLPVLNGCEPGPSWHAAKILECGAAAVMQRVAPDSMMGVIDGDTFDIWPMREDYRCSPQSIASHSLYENADPFLLTEPSGVVDTRDATYAALSDRAVRVTGSKFRHSPEYTVKLEGARRVGFSTIVPGAIRDPMMLKQLDSWLERLDVTLKARLDKVLPDGQDYRIVTRVYGRNGVMGDLEPLNYVDGHEVFIMWDVISQSQQLSHTIASSLSHMAVHFPIPEWNGLISGVAFPFAPSEIDRGPVYEFHLNHVAVLDDPLELFDIRMEEVCDVAIRKVGDIASLVRSKNAGPFWLTFDVMFEDQSTYEKVRDAGVFNVADMAALFGQEESRVKVFSLDPAYAFKISFPRPLSSGSAFDSDIFGGQQHSPLLNIEVDV